MHARHSRAATPTPVTLLRARVAAVHRASLQLLHHGALQRARLLPSLTDADDPLARPGVGDWVSAQVDPAGGDPVVLSVEPRRSAIVRRAAGVRTEPQLLAANVDTALLFGPLPDDVNPRRLARLAALAWEGGATPVVVLSRSDLADVTVIDTPGLREVGMWVGTQGSAHVFGDIEALADGCRFGDCAHEGEPGCAVLEAQANGTLSADRLSQWQQLQREARRAERTVHEQRRLEREGSRAVRRYLRDHPR